MKLIPMTDFVLQYKSDVSTNNEDKIMDAAYAMIGYANFLKQPLTLSMFVPVDGDGDIIDEPNDLTKDLAEGGHLASTWVIDAYNEAKSKVLFEGFKYGECDEGAFIESKDTILWPDEFGTKKIEHLIQEGLTLTDHAKSLIF